MAAEVIVPAYRAAVEWMLDLDGTLTEEVKSFQRWLRSNGNSDVADAIGAYDPAWIDADRMRDLLEEFQAGKTPTP